MVEIRCFKCKKIVGYLVVKSRIAKGTIHTCVNCIYPDKVEPVKPMADLFDGMFGDLFKK